MCASFITLGRPPRPGSRLCVVLQPKRKLTNYISKPAEKISKVVLFFFVFVISIYCFGPDPVRVTGEDFFVYFSFGCELADSSSCAKIKPGLKPTFSPPPPPRVQLFCPPRGVSRCVFKFYNLNCVSRGRFCP